MSELAIDGGPEAAAELDVPEWPQCTERTIENVVDTLESGKWCRVVDGATAVDRFEREFAEYHDAEYAIAVSNGTVAIELALRACGVRPGDEVIVPAYTFIATASAVACMGAVPVFADVDPRTYNLDAESLEASITDRTVGVVGVHFGGYPMDFDEILPVVREHDLFLIEDAAHAQGSEWRGEKVGTIGSMGTFSFQQSKSLPAGEGGVVVTDDELLAEEARLIHNIGRAQGEPGYKHYLLSSNYRLSELQGAVLSAQLERLPELNERRQRNDEVLAGALSGVDGIETKPRDERITARGYCVYNLRYDPEAFGGLGRDRFLEALNAEGVPASNGYEMPLYRQPAFAREQLGALVPPGTPLREYRNMYLPGAETVAETNVSMSHTVLLASEAGVRTIPRAIEKIRDHADDLRRR